jgi:3-methyladenine DNA glycosylase AlkD
MSGLTELRKALFNKSTENEAKSLLDQIKRHADPQHQAGMRTTAPTELKVYGVRVPHLRKIARAWQRAHKQTAREDLVALVEALWDGESREERMLAIHLLEYYRHWVPELTRAHFERWRGGLDNWEIADGLGWTLAFWLLGDPDTRLDPLWALITDEDVWSRRVALVATIPINRGGTGFTIPDLTLQLVDRVKEERHPMITKAVSWVLREMIKHHREQVVAYLEENRDVLANHVVREVDNKLRTGLKSGKGGKS